MVLLIGWRPPDVVIISRHWSISLQGNSGVSQQVNLGAWNGNRLRFLSAGWFLLAAGILSVSIWRGCAAAAAALIILLCCFHGCRIIEMNNNNPPLTFKRFQTIVSRLELPRRPLAPISQQQMNRCLSNISDNHDQLYSIPSLVELGESYLLSIDLQSAIRRSSAVMEPTHSRRIPVSLIISSQKDLTVWQNHCFFIVILIDLEKKVLYVTEQWILLCLFLHNFCNFL